MPFEDVAPTDPAARVIRSAVNRNRFPREALVEAALRFVIDDLPPDIPEESAR